MVEKLTRLYPARWREWYGAEMEQLLEDLAQQSRSHLLVGPRLHADRATVGAGPSSRAKHHNDTITTRMRVTS